MQVVALQKQLTDMEREAWRSALTREAAQQSVTASPCPLLSPNGLPRLMTFRCLSYPQPVPFHVLLCLFFFPQLSAVCLTPSMCLSKASSVSFPQLSAVCLTPSLCLSMSSCVCFFPPTFRCPSYPQPMPLYVLLCLSSPNSVSQSMTFRCLSYLPCCTTPTTDLLCPT